MYTHTNVHKNNNKNIIQIYVATYTVYTKIQKKQNTDQLSFNFTFYIQSKENIASNIAPYFYMSCVRRYCMHITDKGTFEIGMR